jgi:hypothetical protein
MITDELRTIQMGMIVLGESFSLGDDFWLGAETGAGRDFSRRSSFSSMPIALD